MIEDSEDDALLIMRELERSGYEPEIKRVETKEETSEALNKDGWDVVIADYKLPGFSGLGALKLMKEKNIDLPFLVVSGGMEEDIAVEVMKAGAQDFITKAKLMRLSVAIERELREIDVHKEQKKLEEASQKTSEMITDILQGISEGFMVLDENLVVMYFNRAAGELLGRTGEEVIGRNLFEAFPEAKGSIFEEKYAWVAKEKKPVSFETYFGVEPYKNWYDVRVYPRKDGIAVYFQVITERKEAEAALRDSEEKYRMLFENAADLVAVVDPKGNFIDMNKQFEEESGYSRDEMLGKNVFTCGIVSKASVPKLMTDLAKVMMGQEVSIIEVDGVTKDGTSIPYELKSMPLKKEGKIVAVQATLRNLTYRKKIETAQRLAQVGEMMADMAHEIKNPLQVISGRTQIALMEGAGKESIKEGLEIVLEQCNRANDLIQRFLYFSKPAKGDFKEVDINESLEYVLHLIEHPYALRNIKIKKEYVPSLPKLKIDEKRIHEVFLNLVNNSADAIPTKGGTITVRTQVEGDNIRVDIKDTGSGIPEENLKKIFDSFFTTKEKGTGLGIPLCYNIIKMHNGDLKFTSEVGKGTTATIYLPISTD
jgi:PAS domain S-box-containing protein